jgi:hypothetical protein
VLSFLFFLKPLTPEKPMAHLVSSVTAVATAATQKPGIAGTLGMLIATAASSDPLLNSALEIDAIKNSFKQESNDDRLKAATMAGRKVEAQHTQQSLHALVQQGSRRQQPPRYINNAIHFSRTHR